MDVFSQDLGHIQIRELNHDVDSQLISLISFILHVVRFLYNYEVWVWKRSWYTFLDTGSGYLAERSGFTNKGIIEFISWLILLMSKFCSQVDC